MKSNVRNVMFAKLSMYAKMHRNLDAVAVKKHKMIHRIEQDEIRAYEDDITYSRLEELKKQILAIRFLEEK